MNMPQDDTERQQFGERIREQPAKRRAHPGVQVRPPSPPKNPRFVLRYKDPETGKYVDEVIDAKNSDVATKLAKALSQRLATRKQAIAAGSRPHVEAGLGVAAAVERYFVGPDVNKKTLKVYRAAADEFLRWCAENQVRTVRQLSKARLFEYRTWMRGVPRRQAVRGGQKGEWADSKQVRSPHSTNKHLRAMSAILNHLRAGDVVRLSTDDLRDALKRFKAETERKEFYSATHVRAVLDELDGHRMYGLVRCLLLTGLRLEEALLIEWRDVETDVLRIRAAVGKGGHKRDVDLSVARTAFPQRPKDAEDNDRVFAFTEGEVRTVYEACKNKWRPHGLRRTWSTFFVACFGPWRASKSAGHGVLVMERSYAGLVAVPPECASLEQAMQLDI